MNAKIAGAEVRLVTITADELASIVREAVAAALAERKPEPELLDRDEAARFLRISLGTLDRATREHGLPFLLVADARRFVKADLIAWGRERGR